MVGRQLSRNTAHRKALRRNMAASLFEHGAIRTTVAKAKELRGFVEKLITTARQGTLHARRQVIASLGRDRDIVDADGMPTDQTLVQKLFDEVVPRYSNRPGGYTRIIRLSERRIGDAGKQVILQLVEEKAAGEGRKVKGSSRRRQQAAKRREAVQAATAAPQAAAEKAPEQPAPEEVPAEAPEAKDEQK
jgi:large subunit ribosomal protein L17